VTTTETTECRNCHGTGEIDPTENLDMDSLDAVLTELIDTVTDTSDYGLRSPNRYDRMRQLARISFLASRAAWLEACDMKRADQITKRLIDEKIAAGELIRLTGGRKCPGCGTPMARDSREWFCGPCMDAAAKSF